MQLNDGQLRAFDSVKKGFNTFITGGGGVGKSVIINKLKEEFGDTAVFCAPTGIAALNIGGSTLHRVFGLPFTITTSEDYHSNMKNVRDVFGGGNVKTLVIDEISMVRADMFITIDRKLRNATRRDEPFGGIQIAVVGDFFQLPPVLVRSEEEFYYGVYDSLYAFDTDTWDDSKFRVHILDEIMRQSDATTIRAFNSIRHGNQSQPVLNWLAKKCLDNEVDDDDDDAIVLCTTNASAANINTAAFDEIDGEPVRYFAEITGDFKRSEQPVEEILQLKPGARVVICGNNHACGYVNGMQGTVVELYPSYIGVEVDNGSVVQVGQQKWETIGYKIEQGKLKKDVIGSFVQFPLKLGYAITVHKSQGMTLDRCVLDLGRGAFAHGQTYVALSRIRDLSGLRLEREIWKSDIIVDEEVIEFYKHLEENGGWG